MAQQSEQSWKMTPCFCPGKPALRAIQARRVKILPALAPIHVPASNARSAAATGIADAAAIAAVSADAADALKDVPIAPIAAATVTVVVIVARIAVVIEAGDASSGAAAVDMATARIAGITADTLLPAGLN
jgi:hypothetical protein